MRNPGQIAGMTVAAALLALIVLPGPGRPGNAHAQVGLPPLENPLGRPLDPALERVDDRLGSRIRRRAEEAEEKAEELPVEQTATDAAKAAAETIDEAANGAAETVDGVTDAASGVVSSAAGTLRNVLRPFALSADPRNWPVEANVLVTLLDGQQAEAVTRRGMEIVARRDLPALGLSMVTLRKPAGADLMQTIDDLRQALPDAAVDFNHVYRFAEQAESGAAEDVDERSDQPGKKPADAARLKVGMIDSAVMSDHFSLRNSAVVSADFVTNEGTRPLGHGTAVASLIASSAADEAEIWSASVFFQTADYAPGATTESLVAALDWLAAEQVDVINMSLAGPGNALLERAIGAITSDGPVIVAAVGNNGPSGEPLYPAAYDNVIGVTAVDRDGRVFLYANRGEHVDYAALGVNVKVADSSGSWRVESGTSMASPHVAVVVARTLQPGGMALDALQAALTASAEDLGDRGFDPVFGHGLITEAPVLVSRQ